MTNKTFTWSYHLKLVLFYKALTGTNTNICKYKYMQNNCYFNLIDKKVSMKQFVDSHTLGVPHYLNSTKARSSKKL